MYVYLVSSATCKQRHALWKQLGAERKKLKDNLQHYNRIRKFVAIHENKPEPALVPEKCLETGSFPWLAMSSVKGNLLSKLDF